MTRQHLFLALLVLAAATLAVVPAGTQPLQSGASGHAPSGQQPAAPSTPAGASGAGAHMDMDMPGMDMAPAQQAGAKEEHPWCNDTTWSVFNHRIAGWYIALWGLTALIAGLLAPGTWWRFAPGVVLLGLVQFLFFRNDPEAWPIGPMSFWASMHGEDLQHRIFLVLLLVIAVLELLRASNRLPAFLAKYSLAILATAGGIYLFFHQHGGAEMEHMSHGDNSPAMQQMMASMNTVIHEHMWFSILGFGVAGGRLLSDAGILKGRWAPVVWTVFAIALGAYMATYVE